MYAVLTYSGGTGSSTAPRAPATAVAGTDIAGAEVAPSPTAASASLESATAGSAVSASPIPASASPTQRRLNFLFQASVHLSTKSPTISRVLLQQLHEVARKHVLRLHASVKHSCCSSCFSLLLPQNTSVRQYIQGGCRCSNSTCSGTGSACSTCCRADELQKTQVKGPKRQKLKAPSPNAATDMGLDCSSNSGSSRTACIRRNKGAGGEIEEHCPGGPAGCNCCSGGCCCSSRSCCCSSCCRIGAEGERRRWRSKRRTQSTATSGQQQQQLTGQKLPLMEVRCLICGYVSRRP